MYFIVNEKKHSIWKETIFQKRNKHHLYHLSEGMAFSLTWIKEDILAVGQMIQSQQDLNNLYSQGIRAIINLREPDYSDRINLPDLPIYHIPIKDMQTPTRTQVTEFLTTVQYHFERGEPVYVHCTAGCGRTGTMVSIWLISLREYDTIDETIGKLRELRPCSIETDKQMAFVQEIGSRFIG